MNHLHEWEVEEIIDDKMIRNQPHHLIKWVGYGMESNSWEPIENLTNCQNLVDQYHQARGGDGALGEASIRNSMPYLNTKTKISFLDTALKQKTTFLNADLKSKWYNGTINLIYPKTQLKLINKCVLSKTSTEAKTILKT